MTAEQNTLHTPSRLKGIETETNGYLHIKGENECQIYFEVD